MKVYTRQGDFGKTFNPIKKKQTFKSELLFDVLGTIDELQSWIGLVRIKLKQAGLKKNKQLVENIKKMLRTVQLELYHLSSHIVTKASKRFKPNIEALEQLIDKIDSKNKTINKFVLPYGTELACITYIARTICRRAERIIVNFYQRQKSQWLSQNVLIYINRLSDFLFVLARFFNTYGNINEEYAK